MKKIIVSLLIAVLAMVGCVSLVACKNTPGNAIGVQNGTTGEAYVQGSESMEFPGFPNLDCQGFDNAGLAAKAMKDGLISYVIVDEAPAKYLAKNVAGLKCIDIKLTEEEYAFGVDKAQPELLAKVNAFLTKIKGNGTFDSIIANYNSDKVPAGVVSAKKDVTKADKQLVISTNAGFAPFEYKIGDKFAGIDMEIAKLMADEFGMELVIDDMDFGAVVTSVGVNGVDIAMAGLTVNEDRKLSVNFSSTYYEAAQMLVANVADNKFDNCKTANDVVAILKSLVK